MRTFKEWLYNETVTFRIKGTELPESLDKAVFNLSAKVADMFPLSFKNGSFFNDIALDGLTTGDIGVINFYSSGKEDKDKILKAISYLVGEYAMELTGGIKKDTSRSRDGEEVYRIPVRLARGVKDVPPELNVADGNARELLSMLNLNSSGIHSDIDVRELAMKLSGVTDFHTQMGSRAGEKVGNFNIGGLNQDQLQRYIDNLEGMVRWALANDYDTIEVI